MTDQLDPEEQQLLERAKHGDRDEQGAARGQFAEEQSDRMVFARGARRYFGWRSRTTRRPQAP